MRRGDAFGILLRARLDGDRDAQEIVERDDGFIGTGTPGCPLYFAPFRRWPAVERAAFRLVRGDVLDVGAGAGRVALECQRRGLRVAAIDPSPGCVDVARRRGVVDVRRARIEDVTGRRRFDSVVLYGNNLALLGGTTKARRLLGRLARVTREGARIVGSVLDPYATTDPLHLAYHERNRRRGRLGGQLRIRVRVADVASAWFEYCFRSRDEVRALVDGTAWRVERFVGRGAQYVAVLAKRA